MLLIESKDPEHRDIRLCVRDAWVDANGTLERTAELLEERYGVRLGFATVRDWIKSWDWEVRRVLHTPGIPDEEKAA